MITTRFVTESTGKSPRIPDRTLARYPAAVRPPEEHTSTELTRLVALLREAGAQTIAIGHGRYPGSVAAAQALATAWITAGGTVLAVVDWPGPRRPGSARLNASPPVTPTRGSSPTPPPGAPNWRAGSPPSRPGPHPYLRLRQPGRPRPCRAHRTRRPDRDDRSNGQRRNVESRTRPPGPPGRRAGTHPMTLFTPTPPSRERRTIAAGAIHLPGWLDTGQQRQLVEAFQAWSTGPVPGFRDGRLMDMSRGTTKIRPSRKRFASGRTPTAPFFDHGCSSGRRISSMIRASSSFDAGEPVRRLA